MQSCVVCPISCVVCMWACCHFPINVDWVQVQVCPSKCDGAESIPIHPPNLFHARNKTLELQYVLFYIQMVSNSQWRHSVLRSHICALCVLHCPLAVNVRSCCPHIMCQQPGCTGVTPRISCMQLFFCFIAPNVISANLNQHLFIKKCTYWDRFSWYCQM